MASAADGDSCGLREGDGDGAQALEFDLDAVARSRGEGSDQAAARYDIAGAEAAPGDSLASVSCHFGAAAREIEARREGRPMTQYEARWSGTASARVAHSARLIIT